MSTTITYPRPKANTTNATGIVFTLKAAETPGAFANLSGGTTGELTAVWRADANETSTALVKDHMQIVITPSLDATTNAVVFTIVATPIHGDGTLGPARTFYAPHSDSLDAWQTSAGRVRQP